jgi:hypothetical protein
MTRHSHSSGQVTVIGEELMELVPESRVLLGVDVVGSASNPGYYLSPLVRTVNRMLDTAIRASGIRDDEILDVESGGDGALYTLPSSRLGSVLDFSERLDQLVAKHNQWQKPDIRLRIAVELGAVGDAAGYYPAKIYRSRLMNATAFKKLLARCLSERPPGSVNTALIVSAPAFREAFGGDYTELVKRVDFAEMPVAEKEFQETSWVRVPGLDANSVANIAAADQVTDSATAVMDRTVVTNHVNGAMHGVQAGIVSGGITIGLERR